VVDLATAIIEPHRPGGVKASLQALNVTGMTVMEVRGFGPARSAMRLSEHRRGFTVRHNVEGTATP